MEQKNKKKSLKPITEVNVEELLGRESIDLDIDNICEYLQNKVVIVTGGGGSIGSEICIQVARFNIRKLIIFELYENNAYDIQNEIKRIYPNLDVEVLIGSVRDKNRLENIFNKYMPEVIFHAAAYKHVPLMEASPGEAVKNNVFGTLNMAKMAIRYNCKKFVLISTDKAVNPTNIMGATKRLCEIIIQELDRSSNTEFAAVRFGNVLGSNGSVIPLFKKQIIEGGPVTVTHPEVIRYFMTVTEAVQLVLRCGALAKNGEIFILDMGKPVKIDSLARNLIILSGFRPGIDIKIVYTGLRPGEKLCEELLMAEEGLEATIYDKIFVAKPVTVELKELEEDLDSLKCLIAGNYHDEEIRKMLKKMVSTLRD